MDRIPISPSRILKYGGQQLMWREEVSGVIFHATFAEVLLAKGELNRNLILRGDIFLNEFLTYLDQEPLPWIDCFGWNYEGWSYYGYSVVDFEYFEVFDGEKTYFEIHYPFPPHNIIGEDMQPWFDIVKGRGRPDIYDPQKFQVVV